MAAYETIFEEKIAVSAMIDIRKALRSFRFAIQGIRALFYYENNARIHLIAAFAAVVAGFIFSLTALEWCFMVIQIALVCMAEAFNTAIEKLCDTVSPQQNPVIGAVKDLAAGGVLLAAISALITGLVLFLPKFLYLLNVCKP